MPQLLNKISVLLRNYAKNVLYNHRMETAGRGAGHKHTLNVKEDDGTVLYRHNII